MTLSVAGALSPDKQNKNTQHKSKNLNIFYTNSDWDFM